MAAGSTTPARTSTIPQPAECMHHHRMRKLFFAALVLVGAGSANVLFTGCGSDSDESPVTDGGNGESSTTNPNDGGGATDAPFNPDVGGDPCKAEGSSCTTSLGCCTGNCVAPDGGGAGTCGKPIDPTCKAPNEACTTATQCCTGACVGGKCWDKQCVADNGACNVNEECCGQTCTGGKCAAINPSCKSDGNPCGAASECCSKQCNNGVCGNASFCTQTGDICADDKECCGGQCTKAAGAAYGTCGNLPSAGGCEPAGTLCGTGADPSACDNKCCSKACGPWGTTNIRVCQPPSGCKPEYEVCENDDDCCGNDPNPNGGLPPAKQPVCNKLTGEQYGRCTKANQCDPPGAICKLGACGVDNRCCDPMGAPSPSYCQEDPANCCKYDALGIPRCIVAVVDCTAPVPAGTTCATSADCCGKPCVNDKCEGTCVAKGGACTTAADCCTGMPCTNGMCADPLPPPGTDGGTTADGGSTSDGGSTVCALYGQACTVASDCCNGVPCTSNTCRYP